MVGNLVLNFFLLCIEGEHFLVLRAFFLERAGQLLFDLLDGKCFGEGFTLHLVDGLRVCVCVCVCVVTVLRVSDFAGYANRDDDEDSSYLQHPITNLNLGFLFFLQINYREM